MYSSFFNSNQRFTGLFILASLMFGLESGMEFAKRLKHEIRFEDKSDKLFGGFLKLLNGKNLYLKSSKNSC